MAFEHHARFSPFGGYPQNFTVSGNAVDLARANYLLTKFYFNEFTIDWQPVVLGVPTRLVLHGCTRTVRQH